MLTIATLIPTYHRSNDLVRCLDALKKQTRLPDEVLVIVRDTDTETWMFLETFDPTPLPLRTVTVKIPGLIAALNAGLDMANGDIISITDDDAAPHPDWLTRIESHFLSDEKIGGVGGRDWVHHDTHLEDGKREIVGRVQWFGRVIGNHHLGAGEPREVDVIKGVNSSYRRSAIANLRYDENLRASGSSTCCDMAMSLAVRRAGWKLIYDPNVAVDHYPGKRFFQAHRREFNPVGLANTVHNETLILMNHLPPGRQFAFLVWALLVGTRKAPGLAQLLRFLPAEGTLAFQKLLASIQGRWQGLQTWQQCDRS
ncbi:MAG TPA: glycosyl transferase family A [Cyanobacteria bacterium UBA11370]|nr:glycosyl transferase family A [Cyanobacteria bacterium UBA11370]HBY80766.1 glycosyl transferase family A [Cyanobacteria bacterium UBA11148]